MRADRRRFLYCLEYFSLEDLEIQRAVSSSCGRCTPEEDMSLGILGLVCHMKTMGQIGHIQVGASFILRNSGSINSGNIVATLTMAATFLEDLTEVATIMMATFGNEAPTRDALEEMFMSTVAILKNDVKESSTKPSKKENDSETVEAKSVAPKSEQGQKDSAASVKQSGPPQVQLKDRQATEDPLTHTASLLSAEASIEEQAPSETTEDFHPIKEESVEVQLKESQAVEIPSSQTASLPSAEAPPEEQAPSETTESFHPLKKEESVPLEDSQPTDHSSQVNSHLPVEIPFLSDSKEDTELTQMAHSHQDAVSNQVCVALTTDSSSFLASPGDVHFVPVLVREKEIELTDPWEDLSSLHDKHLQRWAPEDYQEPPQCADIAGKCDTVSDCDRDSVSSYTSTHTHVFCDRKSDSGRVLESLCCSPKSHHRSDSSHSSTNWPLRALRCCSPQSPPRRQWSLQSPPRRERHHSRDSQASPGGREDHFRTGSYSHSHYKYCRNPIQERQQERNVPPLYFAHKTHCHHYSKERSKSYRVSHSFSPESPDLKMKTNLQKIKKKILTHHDETEKKKKKLMRSEETKRKKRATSEKDTKSPKIKKKVRKAQTPVSHDTLSSAAEAAIPQDIAGNLQSVRTRESEPLQMRGSNEDPDSRCQPCRGRETGVAGQSMTPCVRSATVLARKEQIEQDYQQVILIFAMVATMLLETQPCMEEAMEAALKTNLRRVGNYYVRSLKDFIDSFDLARAS
ncbi:uncharacterized protein LOC128323309 isoform X4 [Hemicordylus capensis]|uniref:uncharacterized protein LOC128323309 isoform X4 n=1 Tax=Hemicordylus capensis TaxID=884348 RepID=UPI00230494C3|nr:uncharacterized protein LOC128323309 isoform X4 [Hemicordylus capensis]